MTSTRALVDSADVPHVYIVVNCNSPIPDLTWIYTIDHPLWHCNLHFVCIVKINSYKLSMLHSNNLIAVRGPYIHVAAFIAQYCICYRPNSYSSYFSGTTIVPLITSSGTLLSRLWNGAKYTIPSPGAPLLTSKPGLYILPSNLFSTTVRTI